MNDRLADAFAASGKRAALMPYLMGGHPDVETSRACLDAAIEAGADLIELGIPFSDPLAHGPGIPEAGAIAPAAGGQPPEGVRACKENSRRAARVVVGFPGRVRS